MREEIRNLAAPDEIEVLCRIGPSKRSISPEIEAWAETLAGHARRQTSGPVSAMIWPYRQGNNECLSVDLSSSQGGLSLTFITGSAHDFGIDDVEVPDMTEALAMAMLLLKKIDARVTFYI